MLSKEVKRNRDSSICIMHKGAIQFVLSAESDFLTKKLNYSFNLGGSEVPLALSVLLDISVFVIVRFLLFFIQLVFWPSSARPGLR